MRPQKPHTKKKKVYDRTIQYAFRNLFRRTP